MTQRRHRMELLLVALRDLIDHLDRVDEQRGRHVFGVATGFQDLDRITGGIQNSNLVVLAGVASTGKTCFVLSLAHNTALRYGNSVAIFSTELSKEQLVLRFLSIDAGVDQSNLVSGCIDDEEWERISESISRLSELNIYTSEMGTIGMDSLREQAHQLMDEKGFDLLILDSLELIRGSQIDANFTRRQVMDEISRSLKNLARELDAPVLVTYQLPNLMGRRIDNRPQLRDLGEGAALEGDADLLLLAYREQQYDPDTIRVNMTEFNVAKHRVGPTGAFCLYCQPSIGRYRDLELRTPDY